MADGGSFWWEWGSRNRKAHAQSAVLTGNYHMRTTPISKLDLTRTAVSDDG